MDAQKINRALLIRTQNRTVEAVRSSDGQTFQETLQRVVDDSLVMCRRCKNRVARTFQNGWCHDCCIESFDRLRATLRRPEDLR